MQMLVLDDLKKISDDQQRKAIAPDLPGEGQQ